MSDLPKESRIQVGFRIKPKIDNALSATMKKRGISKNALAEEIFTEWYSTMVLTGQIIEYDT